MKREEKKALTKKKILQAATERYSKKGFVNVSIEEISQRAEVGKGTVFLHFQNQDQLMAAVLQELLTTFEKELAKASHEIDNLDTYLSLHLTVLAAHEELYFHFITQRLLLGPAANAVYVGIQAVFAHHFATALKKELTLPLDVVFTSWLGLIHYYLQNRDLFGGQAIISRNKEKWVSDYLCLLNEGGIKK